MLKILVLLLNNLVILPVEDRIKHPPRGVNTTNLANYGTRRKSKRINKWYMDTYGVNKDHAVRDIESVMLRISHK